MSVKELCGWLIKGDPERPCVRHMEHKSPHRDEAYYARKRVTDAQWRADNPKYKRNWYAENVGHVLEYQAQYGPKYRETFAGKDVVRKVNHNRRINLCTAITSPLPDNLTDYLGVLYGWKCQGCGRSLDYFTLTVDHVIPISSGLAMHTLWNMQPMCRACNGGKRDRLEGWVTEEEIQLLHKLVGE